MAASASSKPLQQALTHIIQRASLTTTTHIDPAVARVTSSQDALEAELEHLDAEMERVTSVLETVTLDPETSARMQETQECLRRTKKKLITIRGRLGRLRAYEESDRLRLIERSLQVFGEESVGRDGEDLVEGREAAARVGDKGHDEVKEDVKVSDMISPGSSERAARRDLREGKVISPTASTENEEVSEEVT